LLLFRTEGHLQPRIKSCAADAGTRASDRAVLANGWTARRAGDMTRLSCGRRPGARFLAKIGAAADATAFQKLLTHEPRLFLDFQRQDDAHDAVVPGNGQQQLHLLSWPEE
jgi:hypothetical protein